MPTHDDGGGNSQEMAAKAGWTSLHSWVFLVIVALGISVLAWQNRYHYLSPLGLGKAYRIDKLFGGIQEFDPSSGWISAQLNMIPPAQALSMMEPPAPGIASQAVPMNMPGLAVPQETPSPGLQLDRRFTEHPAGPPVPVSPPAGAVPPTPAQQTELSKEEKLKAFQNFFPQFGQEEFQLANDDLFPDWRQSQSPAGSWNDFLIVYRNFVQWWLDAGSPPEPGFKLWKDFLASKK